MADSQAFPVLLSLLIAVGCSSEDSSVEAAPQDAGVDTPADTLSDTADADAAEAGVDCHPVSCTYGELEPWRTPIEDYLQTASHVITINYADVHKAIDDLIVFENRLYFGYGDATLNLGRIVPIEIRSFENPEVAEYTTELGQTDEEEIVQFRRFGDTLYVPGVDATEDAFLGNVFTLPAQGSWTKHRSVAGGVHVHDIALYDGSLYACGSGALDIDTWETGRVHSYLWRSDDGAQSWDAAADVQNEEVGDRRFVTLMPLADGLHVFGYRANNQGSVVGVLSHVWDGSALSDTDIGSEHFVMGAERLSDDVGLLWGVLVVDELREEALRVEAGAASRIEALSGMTVLDAAALEDGMLVLTADDDAYPLPETPTTIRVWYSDDLATFQEVLSTDLDVWPSAVAYWQGGIYVGTQDGRILRSLGE